jgi:hypothetical protein
MDLSFFSLIILLTLLQMGFKRKYDIQECLWDLWYWATTCTISENVVRELKFRSKCYYEICFIGIASDEGGQHLLDSSGWPLNDKSYDEFGEKTYNFEMGIVTPIFSIPSSPPIAKYKAMLSKETYADYFRKKNNLKIRMSSVKTPKPKLAIPLIWMDEKHKESLNTYWYQALKDQIRGLSPQRFRYIIKYLEKRRVIWRTENPKFGSVFFAFTGIPNNDIDILTIISKIPFLNKIIPYILSKV